MYCFNPYFIGLPILIMTGTLNALKTMRFQSLFYWITYSYQRMLIQLNLKLCRFNPYFIGLPILIR